MNYLCVDRFIGGLVEARALQSAFHRGWIDALDHGKPLPSRDAAGDAFLLDILTASGVVERHANGFQFTRAFRRALEFRDLLEVKLEFALYLAPDWIERFELLLEDPDRFMAESRLMDLFDYARALTYTLENYEATRRWMRLTTVLTRYEAAACLDHYPFERHRRALDVGGNSGEFMRRLCERFEHLFATVFDLPVVCQVGREHLRPFPEGDRIQFVNGSVLTDPLPSGADLICFKSMLHDWPEAEAERFLEKAAQSLAPDGTILIYERLPLRLTPSLLGFSQLPVVLFFRSYRDPQFYRRKLDSLGFRRIEEQTLGLETGFLLLTASRV